MDLLHRGPRARRTLVLVSSLLLLAGACTSTSVDTPSVGTSAVGTPAVSASLSGSGSPTAPPSPPPAPPHVREATLTLQKLDISTQPVDAPFSVTVSITRNQDEVTIDIPSIAQSFGSSRDSPNADPGKPFPAFFEPTTAATRTDSHSYPALPDGYPLGGYVDTVAGNVPAEFRPTGGLPITFPVGSSNPGASYTGSVDHQGRLQLAGPDGDPLGVGPFQTVPTTVTYTVRKPPQVTLSNLQLSNGPSNAAKWNPSDYPKDDPTIGGHTAINFDFGDFNDPQRGFSDGKFYATWADNSAELPGNSPDQDYKSYALAEVDVADFGRQAELKNVVNLSRDSGGEALPEEFSYAEGGVAVDPTNPLNLAVTYQQRKLSRIGFVLSRSFDGGKTWTKKVIGLPDPGNKDQPLDPNLPIGGSDEHSGFDRFGGLWIVYGGGATGSMYSVYSADKGETFSLVHTETRLEPSQVPQALQGHYEGLDYPYMGIGPDATNPDFDTVWTSVGDALNTCAPNEFQQRVLGWRVKGLGIENVEMSSLKRYILPGSDQGGFGSIDVDPSGAVFISQMQTNPKGTYLEQVRNNSRGWLNVLENGLADDAFSSPREFALTAVGTCTILPPQPHNSFLRPGTNMIAVDRSGQHPGRVYAVYSNRPNIDSVTTRPYLTWSDDKGLTWSDPLDVSTDTSAATALLPAISIDPTTGVVAVSWQDARGSASNEEVNAFVAFLDPRELTGP
jgi:hypothetical protein